MSEFEIYKTFSSISECDPFIELFKDNNIDYQLVEDKESVDITFAGNLKIQYLLKIKQDDFNIADKLLEIVTLNDTLNDDHYLNELSSEEHVKPWWLILGYFCVIGGGFLAIFIGMSVYNTTKILPDGRKVFCYDEKSRLHGSIILYSGAVMFIIYLIKYIITF